LIQAVKKLTDEGVPVEAMLLGNGDSLAGYQQLAERLGVEKKVHFLGYIPREELHKYHAEADVFVLPSFCEGMSLAALEAMAAGLPLVLTRTGGTHELIDEGVNGFSFDWADVEQLAEHLRWLAGNRDTLIQMGAVSRLKADAFSWQGIAHRYLNLFASQSFNPNRAEAIS
jgi:glycosyltransferase involved in cell wall biosynthesis